MSTRSVNKVILIGNLGRDPELRYTSSGQPVANFTLATNRQWTDREGQTQQEAEWHRIVAWGKLGEICHQYLTKGRQVYIEGRLQTRTWEDRDGQQRRSTEIVANQMVMLGSPGEPTTPPPSEPVDEFEEFEPQAGPEDDLPF